MGRQQTPHTHTPVIVVIPFPFPISTTTCFYLITAIHATSMSTTWLDFLLFFCLSNTGLWHAFDSSMFVSSAECTCLWKSPWTLIIDVGRPWTHVGIHVPKWIHHMDVHGYCTCGRRWKSVDVWTSVDAHACPWMDVSWKTSVRGRVKHVNGCPWVSDVSLMNCPWTLP